MTLEEIKIRQLTNQYLIQKGAKLDVIRELCGFQAQFMTNALHSMKIRCKDFSLETAADGLVKNWTIRGTVHVFAESDLPLFKCCDNGKSYRLDEWNGYMTWRRADCTDCTYCHYDDGGCERVWALTPERQKYFAHIILDALREGTKTRDELKSLCSDGGMTDIEQSCMFNQWGGGIRELCERGFINYTVQEKKAYELSPPFTPIQAEEAELELARRYFTNFAPATVHDAQYFFHTTAERVKKWLSKLPISNFEYGGNTYFYIDNGKNYDREIPACILLSGFDQLMLGYQKKESLYLSQNNLRGIFNLAGIVMPPILLHGNIVGKWQKKNGNIRFTLFEAVDDNGKNIICENAESLWNDIKKIEWV